ncbi:MAG: translation initiation factor IF-3 [Clostridia bacterium]|nr:translation initiation factor IF-3 [Clostridia bacterium]
MEVFFISAKDTTLINDDIRAKEVRVIGVDGEQVGILPLNDAKEIAYDKGLDLVLISPQADPPVCRIMDYGKFRFERDKKQKEAKKKQQIVKVKEVQLSCRIDTHDFETRVNHARKFLTGGDKVKVIVRFKGREMAHQDIGRGQLEKFLEACADLGTSEKGIVMEGRFMSTIIAPNKK